MKVLFLRSAGSLSTRVLGRHSQAATVYEGSVNLSTRTHLQTIQSYQVTRLEFRGFYSESSV